jgi:hypothetical protein
MSSAPAATRVSAYPPERRLHKRFPIALNADYRILRRGRVDGLGSARTVNIASRGVLLEADISLTAGCPIELFINWPLRLQGVCALRLFVSGRVLRSDSRGVAIEAKHHEFRTAGIRDSGGRPPELKVRSFTG